MKEGGPSPNGGKATEQRPGLIRKDPGWRASCSCFCITPPPPTPHAACLLNLWCLWVLVQVASERSPWDAVPTPHHPDSTHQTPGILSARPGLRLYPAASHSGPDVQWLPGNWRKEGKVLFLFVCFVFKDGLQASGLTFRDLVPCVTHFTVFPMWLACLLKSQI